MNLPQHVEASLRTLGIPDGARIAVACSGGSDSMALLHGLARTSRGAAAVFHVDHGLRSESASDATFVEAAARALSLPYSVRRVTIDPSASSIEAAARDARYQALTAMASETGIGYVGVGHTRDDQAETVLLRLMRGGSLSAIVPVRDIFVRPLLDLGRDDLRAWLTANDIGWRDDPTNTDVRFERNWVRNVLIPEMQRRRPGVATTIARAADRARLDADVLDALAADVFERARIDRRGVFLDSVELEATPQAVTSRVVRIAFRRLGVDPTDREISTALVAKHLSTGGVDVWRMNDGIAFLKASVDLEPIRVGSDDVVESSDWGLRLRLSAADSQPWRWRVPLGDPDATIRTRRPGDRIALRAGTRKVSDVLIDAKVPRALRAAVPVVQSGDDIVGVLGHVQRHHERVDAGSVLDIEPWGTSWSRDRALGIGATTGDAPNASPSEIR